MDWADVEWHAIHTKFPACLSSSSTVYGGGSENMLQLDNSMLLERGVLLLKSFPFRSLARTHAREYKTKFTD
jgi:hypothetical protein